MKPDASAGWALQRGIIAHLEEIWREPDEGIWETRGGRQHFTYSKVMAWVAFDAMIQDAEAYGLDGPVEQWRATRDEIHETVCREGFSPDKNSFVTFLIWKVTRVTDRSCGMMPRS